MQNPIEELRNKHVEQIAWLIGKGPSLLSVTADMMGPGPIITINQAIRKIATLNLANAIYSMQKDGVCPCSKICSDIGDAFDLCPLGQTRLTHGETLLVHCYHSFCCWPNHEPRYVFCSDDWGLWRETPSVVMALKTAQLFGCKTVVMVAFDGMFCADARIAEDGLSIVGNGSLNYVTRQPAHVNPTLREFDNVLWLSPGQTPTQAWPAFYKSNHVPEPPVTQNKLGYARHTPDIIPPQQNSPQLGGQKKWRGHV